jgi:hypothetical protein
MKIESKLQITIVAIIIYPNVAKAEDAADPRR